MCGISGVLSNSRLETNLVPSSIEKISHRGPDDQGFFANGFCSLGMCRLSIIDIHGGNQPNFNSQGQIVSVFNGEIYNYIELRKNLESKGYKIPSLGDSVLIPFLYEEYGMGFARLLQGMFAIAILDTRNHELILIRDRLGKKPLWYCHEGDTLSFSSELKGLLELGIQKQVNLASVPEYLRFGYINAPRSAYLNIKQLEPASILHFKKNRITLRKFWDTNSVKPLEIGFEDAKVETTRLLEDAVRIRMISERPVGAFLSGGIDSTIVTALMAKVAENRIHTFSIGFDDEIFDESLFARGVANAIGTHHHEKIVKPDPVFILETISRSLDSPFADSSIIPTYLLSEFARQEVVVALSGDGGDEGFGGYKRYIATYYLNKINPILFFNPFSRVSFDRLKSDQFRKLLKHLSPKEIELRYRDFQSLFLENDLSKLVNLDIFDNLKDPTFSELWASIVSEDKIRKMQEVDIHSYLPGDLLFKVDIASMANSLEVRSSFLDYRLVELGLSLPLNLKFSKGENKNLLREIARTLVPKELIDRPKKGFGIPRARWLRNELKEMVSDVILSSTFRDRGWFNYSKVEELIKNHNRGKNHDNLIWPILMLELWAQNWLDR